MHATRATRPRNLDRNSVIHFARFANKGGLVCEPERSFDALWDDERHSDIYQSGSGNEETNFRFSRTPEHVTCPDCLEILSERTGTPAPKNAARIAAVLTDYHHGSDRPYRALLHDPATDRQLDKHELIEKLAAQAGAVDGDEIEIQIRKTGARPFGNEKVRLVAPHTYCRGPASEEHR